MNKAGKKKKIQAETHILETQTEVPGAKYFEIHLHGYMHVTCIKNANEKIKY